MAPTPTRKGESRLNGASGVSCTYDGNRRRVQKSGGTLYLHGPGSAMLAEMDAAGLEV